MRRVFMLTLSLCVVILALAVARPVRAQGGGVNLLSGLVSYWDMDEASGTRYDSHGDNDLTDNNTVGVTTTAVLGNAASFVAANSEYLSHADNESLSIGDNSFTLSMWVYPTSATKMFLADKSTTASFTNIEFRLLFDGNTRVYIANGSDYTLVSAGGLGVGSWNHIVVTYNHDSDYLSLSVNGSEEVNTGTTGSTDTTGEFRIGTRYDGDSPMNGAIDEIGFWKRALTADERAALYNDGAGMPYSQFDTAGVYYQEGRRGGGSNLLYDLVSYWDMDGTSQTRYDVHGTNDLAAGGNVADVTGKLGNAAEFESGYGDFLYNDYMDLDGTSFTLSMWFVDINDMWAYISPITGDKFDLWIGNTAAPRDYNIKFTVRETATDTDYIATTMDITPTWQFLSVWYDIKTVGAEIGLQVNDDVVTKTTTIQNVGSDYLYIGSPSLLAQFSIDEVGLWHGALTENERDLLYNDGDGLPYSAFDEVGVFAPRATWTPQPTPTSDGVCRDDDACPSGTACLVGDLWVCQGTAPTNTPVATLRPTLTATPTPTPEPTSNPIPTPTATLSPTATLTPIPTLTLIPGEWITVPIEGNSRYQYAHTGIEGVLPSFANGFSTEGSGWLYWAQVTVDSVNQGNLLFVVGGIMLAMLILGWIIDQVKNPRI